jgi:ketosteroid isomerase-like protein
MRSLLLVVLLACAGTATGYGQESSESETISKIIALENVWNRAAAVKDIKALDKILDDTFVYVGPDGKLLTKAGVLADMTAGRGLQVFSGSLVVHLHGDTAVVTGISLAKSAEGGKPFMRQDRFVDTWHHKNGAWMAIASLAAALGS